NREGKPPMSLIEFTNSSAISKISFNHDDSEIGVAFTANPDKYYYFQCEDVDNFIEKLEETVNANESLGKFISGLRKDGTLISL
ncbi:MAG: hypothetical protein ACK56F_13190, partial [bacterium]